MAGGGELSVVAQPRPKYGWPIITVQVGESGDSQFLEMVLSTLSSLSGISIAARNSLLATGHLATVPSQADRYLLRHLKIDGQDAPDLEVGINRAASHVGVAGFLGLDFFALFATIHVDVPSLRLTFVAP